MASKTVTVDNVFFKPMQFLYDLINTNIQDPNKERRESTNPKDRQWIFPNLPEANDENYPRIALIAGSIRFEEYGAGRFIETVTDSNGKWVSETRGMVAVLPFTIGVFVKKKQTHKVEDNDKTLVDMQNTKLADYIGYRLARIMMSKRPEAIAKNMDLFLRDVTGTYEDNEFLYAKNIDVEFLIWFAEEETFDPDDVIRQISLSLTPTLVGD